MINRRRHPTLVGGSWDFLGVLLAASGLLLIGGPALLSFLYDRDVPGFPGGEAPSRQRRVRRRDFQMVADLGALLRRGAGGSVTPWSGGAAQCRGLQHRARRFGRDAGQGARPARDRVDAPGNRIFIGFRSAGRKPLGGGENAGPPLNVQVMAGIPRGPEKPMFPARGPDQAVLDVEPFYATRNVTLHWTDATGRSAGKSRGSWRGPWNRCPRTTTRPPPGS